jgi:hypothetical protein
MGIEPPRHEDTKEDPEEDADFSHEGREGHGGIKKADF